MEQFLLIVQCIIAASLIGMILIQRSDQDGFGLGGGGGGIVSGRTKASVMTRTTAILAGLFIVNSLALSVLAARSHAPSIVDTIEQQQSKETPGVPAVPLVGADKAEKKKIDEKISTTTPQKPSVTKDNRQGTPAEKKPEANELLGKPVDKTVEKPAAKPAKKPVVKPADETPSEPDHNNE